MPELPEVEVVRRGLHQHVVGRSVRSVVVNHPRAVRRQDGGAAQLSGLLTGRTLVGSGRRGKFLWLTTDDPDLVLAAHLGMSGQFRVDSQAPDTPLDHHQHARVGWDLGERWLWFLDQRTFGWVAAVDLVQDSRGIAVPSLAREIALDVLDPQFDVHRTARLLHRRSVEVKRLLLDQSVVSGIGNIYADEALWQAQVHPRRPADRLPVGVLAQILEAAAEVMTRSLAAGGTSFDSLYVDVNGRSGYYGRGLAVYGRTGDPCPRCATPIQREHFMNRSSHLCPACQRPPRAAH